MTDKLSEKWLEKIRQLIINPRPGSKVAAAKEFGIDLTLTFGQLKKTPQERVEHQQSAMRSLEEFRRQVKESRKRKNDRVWTCNKSPNHKRSGFCYHRRYCSFVLFTRLFSKWKTWFLLFADDAKFEENCRCACAVQASSSQFSWGFAVCLEWKTLQNGTNFTLATEIGDIDLLGEVAGLGDYATVEKESEIDTLYDCKVRILTPTD